jgi:hypothetical protein
MAYGKREDAFFPTLREENRGIGWPIAFEDAAQFSS